MVVARAADDRPATMHARSPRRTRRPLALTPLALSCVLSLAAIAASIAPPPSTRDTRGGIAANRALVRRSARLGRTTRPRVGAAASAWCGDERATDDVRDEYDNGGARYHAA